MTENPEDSDFDAKFEELISQLGPTDTVPEVDLDVPEAPRSLDTPRCLGVILTPVASAEALAALCSIAGVEIQVVPSDTGAVAFLEIPISAEEAGLGGMLGLPGPATEAAAKISQLTHAPAVLLVSWLAPGNEVDPGMSGQVSARRYVDGAEESELPAGAVVARMDARVEELLLGRLRPEEMEDAESSAQMPRWKALRKLGKGLRKPRREQ